MKPRRYLSLLHRYTGLLLVLIALLAALTGSVLTFAPELDRLLNPELFVVKPHAEGASVISLDAQVNEAVSRQGEQTGASWFPLFISPSASGEGASHVWFRRAHPERAGKFLYRQVFVDPYTAQVLGQRERSLIEWNRAGFVRLLTKFHGDLLLGDVGHWIMAVSAVIWVLTSLIGLFLWWPGRKKLALALSVKRTAGRRRLIFDLHRVSGFYSLPVLLVVVFTGIYLALPSTVRSLVAAVATVEMRTPPPVKPLAGAARLSIEQAVAVAMTVFPDGELKRVSLPMTKTEAYAVTVRQADEVQRQNGGRSLVWIDPYRGDVLAVSDGAKMPVGSAFLNWQHPLHSGTAFGLAGRIAVMISGLVAALMVLSGLLIWWQRNQQHARKQAALQSSSAAHKCRV
jgi:uncharacterized iron-regulated membrane protein